MKTGTFLDEEGSGRRGFRFARGMAAYWAEQVLRLRCAPLRMTGFFDMLYPKQVAIIFRGLILRQAQDDRLFISDGRRPPLHLAYCQLTTQLFVLPEEGVQPPVDQRSKKPLPRKGVCCWGIRLSPVE